MRPPAEILMIESTKDRYSFEWRWDFHVTQLRPLLIGFGIALIAVLLFSFTAPLRASSLAEAALYAFFSSAVIPLLFPLFLIAQTLFNSTKVTLTDNHVLIEQKPFTFQREIRLQTDQITKVILPHDTNYNRQGANTRYDLIAFTPETMDGIPLIKKWPHREVVEFTQHHLLRFAKKAGALDSA